MEIRKLNFGRVDTPLLQLMRRVLREARGNRKGGTGTVRAESRSLGV
jgi:hypothetical protein